ncbi:Abi-alpha family protein [Nocardioides limicola]|uniref:Abi-alpha family protein n=1 Tax=Nocardioides limicola TaxID=2803368 RepID=UPI001EF054BF|nr:Abi-alpha family protein [Nocardioides sp. DJM-14]
MGLPAEVRAVAGLGAGVLVSGAAATLRVAAAVTNGMAGWCEQQVEDRLGIRVDDGVPELRALPGRLPASSVENSCDGRLDHAMRGLLDRANDQTTTGSRHELFAKILDQLVPDEARIISALSDGSSSPLVDVLRRSMGRQPAVAVLENMSLVGRTANLALPHLTPQYVGHLLSLGLVEIGAEDVLMKDDYEILAADMAVLGAIKRASRRAMGARVKRRTLRLSMLGRELWAAVTDGAV